MISTIMLDPHGSNIIVARKTFDVVACKLASSVRREHSRAYTHSVNILINRCSALLLHSVPLDVDNHAKRYI